jgi:predicted SprT family Zn-dependent metalloprotease
MRRASQIAASLACVAIILGGARYAYAREAVRHTDLGALYQDINQKSFDGKLPDVEVQWDDLTTEDAYGMTFINDTAAAYSIELDRRTVTNAGFLREVVQHETCHVFTGPAGRDHGAEWTACMERFH